MLFRSELIACFVGVVVFDVVSSVAIYKDTEIIKKSEGGRTGRQRQLNDLPFYDDDLSPMSSSRYRDSLSQWESAEWPRRFGGRDGDGGGYDEYEERPYDWFYYNKYLTNGRFNHLYNGPGNDDQAGMGEPENNNRPRVLPRPEPSFGRANKPRKTTG